MGTDEITAPQDAPSGTGNSDVTACMLIIGNEVLSGRTQDKNLSFLVPRWVRLVSICARRVLFLMIQPL